jgi:ubiquinone/menaquinone biosynthesis C-methylase UbiE
MQLGIKKGLVILALMWLSSLPPLLAQERQPGRLFPPEKIAMLEEHREWQDAEVVMDALRLREGETVADIGAGSGYFTLPMAQRVGAKGLVYAEDVQQPMVDYISNKVAVLELTNVKVVLGKADDPTLPENSLDLALLANTYHEVEKPLPLLENVGRQLKKDGRLAIIDWDPEKEPPFGPPKKDKVSEEVLMKEVKQAGFRLLEKHTFMPYHYFFIFRKR